MKRVLENIQCDLDSKVKGQILMFLVNASPHNPLDVTTSNFAGAFVTWHRRHWEMLHLTLTRRSKVK